VETLRERLGALENSGRDGSGDSGGHSRSGGDGNGIHPHRNGSNSAPPEWEPDDIDAVA